MDVRHFTEPIHFTQPVAFAGRRTLSRACFCVQKPCIRIGNEVAAECDHIHLSFSDYPWAIGQERMIGLDGPDHPVWVSGKTDAIEDALRNLIDNAVVYSLPRSEVTVTVLTKGAVPPLLTTDLQFPSRTDRAFSSASGVDEQPRGGAQVLGSQSSPRLPPRTADRSNVRMLLAARPSPFACDWPSPTQRR
ncbi:hypothetical protein ACVWY2_001923 [Bradyrhizobium sp. JR6.1]